MRIPTWICRNPLNICGHFLGFVLVILFATILILQYSNSQWEKANEEWKKAMNVSLTSAAAATMDKEFLGLGVVVLVSIVVLWLVVVGFLGCGMRW